MGCCGGSTPEKERSANPRVLKLQFLFLDENVCKPCGGTGQALDEAVETVAAPLAAMGATLTVERLHVATRDDAIAQELTTSPTIRCLASEPGEFLPGPPERRSALLLEHDPEKLADFSDKITRQNKVKEGAINST